MPILRPFPDLERRQRNAKADARVATFALNVDRPETVVAPMSGVLTVVSSQPGADFDTRSNATVRITQGDISIEMSPLLIPIPMPPSIEVGDVIGVAMRDISLGFRSGSEALPYAKTLAGLGGYTDNVMTLAQGHSPSRVINQKKSGLWPVLLAAGAFFLIQRKNRK